MSLAPVTHYMVEAAWGTTTGGLFTFGTSLFGSTDQLAAAPFSAAFNVPYGDLSTRTRHISIVRGRDDFLSDMQAGTCTIDLRDPDGLLNNRNTASPLAGLLFTEIPIRVSAYLSNGVKVGLFYGFVDTITSDPAGRGTAQITATDLFKKLQREQPNLGSLSGLTTGSLLQAFATELGWSDPALISLGVGDTLPSPYTRADGTRDLLSLIVEAMQAERGFTYIGGDGTFTYKSRYQVLQSVSQATISKLMTSAPAAVDGSRVRTRWTVQRTDQADNNIGVAQVASIVTTEPSYTKYHYIDDSIVTPLLLDDNVALSLAQYLLAATKAPTGVGWQVPINPSDAATLDQLIQRDLGDRVTLTVAPRGWSAYTQDYIIQQVRHDISTEPRAPRHQTTWGVSEYPAGQAFTFGVSRLGGADYLAY
jgi:hypothetical protein